MELESPNPPFEENSFKNFHFGFRNPSLTLQEDTKSFASCLENQDFWPKNGQIWPNICLFGPFWCYARPKNIENKVRSLFSDMQVPKLLLPFQKVKFGPKNGQIGLKYVLLVMLGQILAFLIHLVPTQPNKNLRTRCLGVFLI